MSARTKLWLVGDADEMHVVGAAGEIAARLNEDRRVVSLRSASTGREIFIAPAHVAMLEEIPAPPVPGEEAS